jgi:hypothetical protein
MSFCSSVEAEYCFFRARSKHVEIDYHYVHEPDRMHLDYCRLDMFLLLLKLLISVLSL